MEAGQVTPKSKRTLRIVSKCATKAEFIAVFRRLVSGDRVFIATRKPKDEGDVIRFKITLADNTPMLVGEGKVVMSDTTGKSGMKRPGMQIQLGELDAASRQTLELLRRQAPPPPSKIPAATPTPAQKPGPKKTVMGMAPPKAQFRVPTIPPISKDSGPIGKAKREDGAPQAPAIDNKTMPLSGLPLVEPDRRKTGERPATVPPHEDEDVPTAVSEVGSVTAMMAGDETSLGERTKGSDIILPANPFGEVNAESLEAFVECTLYEEGTTITPEGDEFKRADTSIPTWWPGGDTPAPEFSDSDTDDSTVTQVDDDVRNGAPSGLAALATLGIEPSPSGPSAVDAGAAADDDDKTRSATPPRRRLPAPNTNPPAPAVSSGPVSGIGPTEKAPAMAPVGASAGATPGKPSAPPPPASPKTPPPPAMAPTIEAPAMTPGDSAPGAAVASPTVPSPAMDPIAGGPALTEQIAGSEFAPAAGIGGFDKRKLLMIFGGATLLGVILAIVFSGGDEKKTETSDAPGLSSDDPAGGNGSGTLATTPGTDAGAKPAAVDAAVEADVDAGTPEADAGAADATEVAEEDAAPDAAAVALADAGTEPKEPDAGPVAASATGPNEDGKCRVSFSASPKRTAIYLGRKRIGYTPLEADVECKKNKYAFHRERYDSAYKTFDARKTTEVKVRLRPSRYYVKVSSQPSGATVRVNGRRVGKTPTRARVRPGSKVSVKISKKGYRTWSGTVRAKKRTTSVRPRLRRKR